MTKFMQAIYKPAVLVIAILLLGLTFFYGMQGQRGFWLSLWLFYFAMTLAVCLFEGAFRPLAIASNKEASQ